MDHVPVGLILLTCAILAERWAMDLGFRQSSQALWGLAGFVLGPIALLMFYVRLINKRKAEGLPAVRW